MATSGDQPYAEQIGDAAGAIWQYLHDHGSASIARVAREVPLPRDLVMQGLGWLAREGKVTVAEEQRSKIVSLRVER